MTAKRRQSPTAKAGTRWRATLGVLLGAGALAITAPATAGSPKLTPREDLPAEPTDARTLLRALASVQGLEARFVERKKLALLKAPLVSEGRLYYMRPGYMARIVESPVPSVVRIGPASLEVEDAEGKQTFDLRSRPDIKMFVESFVHVVAGDYDRLADTYDLGFRAATERGGEWTLTLTPVRKPLSDLVQRLEIVGRGYEVTTVRVLEKKGDSTEITMRAVDPGRRFSAEDRRRIFGVTAQP